VLKDLQELELRELQCKQRREYLELQMQLDEADAECHELGGRLVVVSELNSEAAEWVDDKMQFPMPAPHIGEAMEAYVARADHCDIENLISQGQLQQQQMLKALQMPHAELSAFDGDPLKYWMFITAFKNNVGCLSVDNSKKLTRLLYYCRGKAVRVIQYCASMDPKIGYAKTRILVEKRFGNRYTVTEAWMANVTKGPILDNWDADGLQEFADNLRCCKETLAAMGNSQEVDSQRVLVKIVERLPAYLQVRWRKSVGDIRRKSGKMPDFGELVKFVEASAEEVNDPVYGQLLRPRISPSSILSWVTVKMQHEVLAFPLMWQHQKRIQK